MMLCFFFFSSRRRHTRCSRDWSSDVCSSDLDWQRVVHGMIGVTTRGTAAAIGAHAAYSFAGKTGTAQVFTVARTEKYNAKLINERLRDHSWFIAFAPADQPRIALAVLEENGGGGARAPRRPHPPVRRLAPVP